MTVRKVTDKPNVQSISDFEVIDRLANAYRIFVQARDSGQFGRAGKAYKSYGIYKDEVLRRMKQSDPILSGRRD